MIKEAIQDAINEQINEELYSSYLYLSMAAYCKSTNFAGFGHWFTVQAEEERQHAHRLLDYLVERGGKVVLKELKAPPSDFKSVQQAFEQTLEHEKKITALIEKLYELAIREKDYATQVHLQWFLSEQVEEEASAGDILEKIRLVGGKPGSLIYLDRHMAKRESAK